MDWNAPVDIYCERLEPGFWAEPVNAVSNLAFILAALWGAWLLIREDSRARDLWLLVGMTALIGIGSFVFHTVATVWASLADTIPIWSFVLVFVIIAMRRYFGMSAGGILFVFGALILVAVGFTLAMPDTAPGTRPVLNGSLQYAPALIAQLAFVIGLWRAGHPAFAYVATATAVFFVSLVFRTTDFAVCGAFPAGTHFMWHTLNGLMIAIFLTGIIRHGRPVNP
ncbi:MAG: ceramidase domain-containing protein [Flavobacteriaceae bacterium]